MALLKDLIVFGATNLVSDTFGNNIFANGFHHNEHDNDDHVLLAGGGHMAISELNPSTTNTLTGSTAKSTSSSTYNLSLTSTVNGVASTKSITKLWSSYIDLQDIRGTAWAPNHTNYPEKSIIAWFNQKGTPASDTWYSGISVKGYANNYASWQLAGYSGDSTTKDDNLYFRNGINSIWNAWKTILDSSNSSVSDTSDSITVKINNETATLTNTDSHVNQSNTTTSSWRPVILGKQAASKSSTSLYTTVTDVVYTTNVLQYQPSTGILSSKILDLTETTNAPMTVASSALVSNLNADLLDGIQANELVPKKFNNFFYPYIGSNTSRSIWYKITLPWANLASSTEAWMMTSMEIVLGGAYLNNNIGRIYLQYYFFKNTSNVWVARDVQGLAVGYRIIENSITIKYDLSNPGIIYIKANANQYNTLSIENLSANDTATSLDFRNTTIEQISESTIPSQANKIVPLYYTLITSNTSNIPNTLAYYDIDGNINPAPNIESNGSYIHINTDKDIGGTANDTLAPFTVGQLTGQHIAIDGNEILSKTNGTTPGTLYLQDSTGYVNIYGTGGLIAGDIRIAYKADDSINKRTISSISTLYLNSGASTSMIFQKNAEEMARFDKSGNFVPNENIAKNLGTSSLYWNAAFLDGNGDIHWNNLVNTGNQLITTKDTNRGLPRLLMGNDTGIQGHGSKLWGMSPESITVEITSDNGSTWTENTSLTNDQKRSLTNGNFLTGNNSGVNGVNGDAGSGNTITLGVGWGQRITIDFQVEHRFGRIECLLVYTYNYNQNCSLFIERWNKNKNTWTEVYPTTSLGTSSDYIVIYPETSFYLNGNTSSTTSTYTNKLRFTFIITELSASPQRYGPRIGLIAGWGNGLASHTRSDTYPYGRLFDITMSKYGIPLYLSNRNNGVTLMPVQSLRIYGTGAWNAANTSAYADLIIGNDLNVNEANEHAEGRIYLYSAATKAHIIRGTSTNTDYSHYFPNSSGWIATGGNGTSEGVGSSTKPVYLSSAGKLTECNSIPTLESLTGLTSTAVGSVDIPIYWTGSAFATVQATFGSRNYGEHNANNIKSNGLWYYSSNGPSTSLGASTEDGALYSQAYSTSWVAQIAQDYRNGSIFARGLNNGTWTSWKAIIDSDNRHAAYGGTGSTNYIKIKINSTKSWMLSFMVRVYQGYNHYDIVFSGYNKGNDYWNYPKAVLVSSTTTHIDVYFGYESANNLFVVITGGSYTGLEILNVTNGYTQINDKLVLSDLFTITNSTTLPTTIQKTDVAGTLEDICNATTGAIRLYAPAYGKYWANLSIQTTSSTTTQPQFGSVGINAAVNSDYKLYVSGASMFNGKLNIDSNSMQGTEHINFNRASFNYINVPTGGTLAISVNGSSAANSRLIVNNTSVCPGNSTNSITLGSSSYRWKAVYIGTKDTYGTTKKPIYWNNGVPAECTYEINSSISVGIANRMAFFNNTNSLSYAPSIYSSGDALSINKTTAPDNDGNFQVVGTSTMRTIIPELTNSYDLGSANIRFKTSYNVDEFIGTTNGSQCHLNFDTTNKCLRFTFD